MKLICQLVKSFTLSAAGFFAVGCGMEANSTQTATSTLRQALGQQSAAKRISAPASKCVDVAGNDNGTNGAHAQMWDCVEDAEDQFWHCDATAGSLSTLGRCLDVVANATQAGSPLPLWACNGAGGQVWRPRPDGTLFNRNRSAKGSPGRRSP